MNVIEILQFKMLVLKIHAFSYLQPRCQRVLPLVDLVLDRS